MSRLGILKKTLIVANMILLFYLFHHAVLFEKMESMEEVQTDVRTTTNVAFGLELNSSLQDAELQNMQMSCPKAKQTDTAVEDILCTKRPYFLPNYKNPCWFEENRLRCLQYFHIIGLPKAATTDLFQRLVKHPEIVKNRGFMGKEIMYWSWKRYGHWTTKGGTGKRLMTFTKFLDKFRAKVIENNHVDEYHRTITGLGDPVDFADFHWNFKIPQNDPNAEELVWTTPYLIKHINPGVKLILQLRDPIESGTIDWFTGLGDPVDFADFHWNCKIPQNDPNAEELVWTTPYLIKHINPGVKLILQLRDPVERLYSYYFFTRRGKTNKDFDRDVIKSMAVWTNCTQRHTLRHCLYDLHVKQRMKVSLYSSFYSSHLKEWLNVFPRQQIYVVRTEDYEKDKKGTLKRLFNYLNVTALSDHDLDVIANLPKKHVTARKTRAGPMLNTTKQLLVELYRNSTIELAKLLQDKRFAFRDRSFS